MKITVKNYQKDYAEVGYIENGKMVTLTKCEDYSMGKKSNFWRIDHKGITVESLIRTKSEAVDKAKKYIKRTYGKEA